MRKILVPVADRPECGFALQAAFGLARRLGSDVTGCHFRPAPVEPGNWNMADLWQMNQTHAWPVPDDEAAAQAAGAAKRLFESQAAQAGYALSDEPGSPELPHAAWQAIEGSPIDAMQAVGGASDMLVVSRGSPRGGEKAWIVLTSALLDSLRPVLVLPQRPVETSGRRIAVAWNRGRMETLTLHAALPMLKRADDVVLLTVGTGAQGRGPTSDDIRRFLGRHEIAARAKQVERTDEGQALVESAAAENADVLLAGAYTRGRLRQMLFGGVTEHLLTRTDFPVLLMHA